MKPYTTYKPSGIDWIGEIPKHWNVTRLKFTDEVIMGQSPSSDDYNLDGKGIPFLQGNAEFGVYHPKPKYWCDTANKTAKKGDILFSVRAPIGAVNVADQTYGIGRGLCAIRARENNSRFLYYYALYSSIELDSIGTGSTYTAISIDDINNLFLTFPSLSEQHAIARFLDDKTCKIDTLIEKKQRLIELLKEQRTAIIKQAVTKGLPAEAAAKAGINSNVKMKDSGIEWIGEIPEHWEIKKLKYVAQSVQTGKTPPSERLEYFDDGDVDWFTPADFNESLLLADSKRKVTTKAIQDQVVRLFKPNSVLIVGIGATLGKSGIIDKPSSANQQINAITFTESYSPLFGLYYLKAMEAIIVSLSNASTLAIFNQDDTKNLTVLNPPRHEQDEIVRFIVQEVERVHKVVLRTEKEIELLQEYRTALISEVVTGKIDVRDYIDGKND